MIRHGFPFRSIYRNDLLRRFLDGAEGGLENVPESERGVLLGQKIAELRPELDLYLVTDNNVEEIAARAGEIFKRIFFREEDHIELYNSIMKGVGERHRTPFFNALHNYAKQPIGTFHALPHRARQVDLQVATGSATWASSTASTCSSPRPRATTGGLDRLLEPTGNIKLAQEIRGARVRRRPHLLRHQRHLAPPTRWSCRRWCAPGDIVLVDRNCHKSHHYGLVLAGAQPLYLDALPADQYSMYGAVPLRHIKQALLDLTPRGTLDRVRMVMLTNCTFDGHIYNIERVMEECLAIKPDLIFLWDEAWFGFARFYPFYRRAPAWRRRDAREAVHDPAYAKRYDESAGRARRRRLGRRRACAEHAAAARPATRCACASTPRLDAQVDVGAAPGLDDPRVGPGLQGQGRGGLPRGVHDPHLDLAEPADHRLARRRRAARWSSKATSWCSASSSSR